MGKTLTNSLPKGTNEWKMSTWKYAQSLATRERQMKTTVSYYYTRIRMAEIKKKNRDIKWCEDGEKLDHSVTAGGVVRCYSHSGRHFSSFL